MGLFRPSLLCALAKERWQKIKRFKTMNINYSTKPSIIYILCCKIVLMFYNVKIYD